MPKTSDQSKIKKPPLHWFKKTFLYCFLFFGFIFFSYMGYLDYTVRQQFEGKRWSIPARVYASPVEIYSGYQSTLEKFENLLLKLHYQRDYHLSSEGSYYKKDQQINLKTRDFVFWDKQQQSDSLRIQFSNTAMTKIIDLDDSTEKPIVRMDPVQIGHFYPSRKEDRILIQLEQTPKTLIQGLLATEDRNFYQHFGVSLKAIARALWTNFQAGAVVQGGSTITQQLVKNFYLNSEKSLKRKINEALIALILEFRYQKDEILEAYLNEIYLGQDRASAVHGFGLASQFYFGRPLKNLPLHDIATLIALVRGPSYYDPRRHPERTITRRNLVLDKMQQQKFISEQQSIQAKQQKLNVIALNHRSENRYPSFLDLVKRQLRQEYREDDLTSEGLRIFTSLDTQIQDSLEQTITEKLKQLEKKPRSSQLETAVLVTRRESGDIVALAGGRNPRSMGFNRALDALRPIGSLIKPAIYLTALESPNKYTITTTLSDTAMTIKGNGSTPWQPKNYDNKQHGDVALHTALSQSYNLATVHIGMELGVANVANTLSRLGVSRAIDLYPSFLLGAFPLTPLEVTQMYQTLAGDGFTTPLRSIWAVMAADGEKLQSYPYTVKQTVDAAATYITNTILQETMLKGTGRSAYRSIPETFALVGKTGTTNKLRDSWFAGFSGDYLSVAWVGRDDNKPMGLTGASGALQLWTDLMKKVSTQAVNLIAPDNIEMYWIDPENGLRANQSCVGAVLYPYVKGSVTELESPCVYPTPPIQPKKIWFDDFFTR